jgi:hypothetical protein
MKLGYGFVGELVSFVFPISVLLDLGLSPGSSFSRTTISQDRGYRLLLVYIDDFLAAASTNI